MPKPRALILRTAGTNCDMESAYACEQAGFTADRVHINRIVSGEVPLDSYTFLFIPGGFSYGDDVAAGKIMALELNSRFGDELRRFEAAGRLVLGVCNGFQVLIKTGLLPFQAASTAGMRATLTDNDSGKFEDRWVHLTVEDKAVSVFTRNMPSLIELPVAHGEGKFVVKDPADLDTLAGNGQIALRYATADGGEPSYPADPNGSDGHIAAVSNDRGTIFGLMPHPERYLDRTNHPRWTRGEGRETADGALFFRNAFEYCCGM